MADIPQLLIQIKERMEQQNQDIIHMKEEITSKIIEHLDIKLLGIAQKNAELEEKFNAQQQSINYLDKYMRRRNILFFGVEAEERTYHDLEKKILNIINNKMNLNFNQSCLEYVGRMGRDKGKLRPVIVTLTTVGKKFELLKSKRSLNETNYYIMEDFPKAVLEKRRELKKNLEEERKSGKNAVLKYDKIIILDKQETTCKNKEINTSENLSSSAFTGRKCQDISKTEKRKTKNNVNKKRK